MVEKYSRNLVNGFLRAKGKTIVNGKGEEILLSGWGLGNWLLPEGYMWLAGGGKRFDRPRRIEAVVRELTGSSYSERFWVKFRENYITRDDIAYMAELGYNSIRIPINWRILMEDEPGIHWKEDGFKLIDRCLEWCEEFKLYAFLDLHGAPGGQTGANIDDSVDDFPRLFTDRDSWEKGIELWREMARRYRDRWIVGGYDLLNEPLRPGLVDDKALDYLLMRLARFYEEAAAAIREIDKNHMLSIEGHHWSTDTSVFSKRYDDNMVIHFHRYHCMPGLESLDEYLKASERLDLPLWLGETGENYVEWFAALYHLSAKLGIGYNIWPWKKMSCINSPCSIDAPEGWDRVTAYTHGGPRPGYEEAQEIFDRLLENIKLKNCVRLPKVTQSVFRRPGCRVRGTDFDLLPGKGISYSGLRDEGNVFKYQTATGMAVIASDESADKRFTFDIGWDMLTLELKSGEFSSYSFCQVTEGCTVSLELICLEDAEITILQDGKEAARMQITAGRNADMPSAALSLAQETVIKVLAGKGRIHLNAVTLNGPKT